MQSSPGQSPVVRLPVPTLALERTLLNERRERVPNRPGIIPLRVRFSTITYSETTSGCGSPVLYSTIRRRRARRSSPSEDIPRRLERERVALTVARRALKATLLDECRPFNRLPVQTSLVIVPD
jgi:hypothetical protein